MAEGQTEKVTFTKSARDARTSRVYQVGQEAELDSATAQRFREAGVLGEGGEAADIPKQAEPIDGQTEQPSSGGETEQHPSAKARGTDKEA